MRDIHTRLMTLLFTAWALSAVIYFVNAIGMSPA